jgi:hypothetical protein
VQRAQAANMTTVPSRGAVFCLLALIVLGGCSTTSNELRTSPIETGSFHVPVPFANVRANLLCEVTKRYHGGTRASHFYFRVDDTKSGETATFEVTQGGVATRVMLLADISKSPSGGTDLTYFVGPPFGLREFRPIIQAWATGESNCGAPSV